MANAPVKIWGKFSQYALQILDFTLNIPHEILGPVAPPTLKDQEYLPRDVDEDFDEDTDESSSELVDNDPYINDTESDDDDN